MHWKKNIPIYFEFFQSIYLSGGPSHEDDHVWGSVASKGLKTTVQGRLHNTDSLPYFIPSTVA